MLGMSRRQDAFTGFPLRLFFVGELPESLREGCRGLLSGPKGSVIDSCCLPSLEGISKRWAPIIYEHNHGPVLALGLGVIVNAGRLSPLLIDVAVARKNAHITKEKK